MKAKHLWFVLFVCVLLLIPALLATPAQAAGSIPEGLEYSISNGEVAITDYTGTAAELEIPSEIDGCPVTTIAAYAFDDGNNLISITIPEGINKIGEAAFAGCYNLENVNITSLAAWCNIDMSLNYSEFDYQDYYDVEYMYGASPFLYADNLYLNGTLVTELNIPDGVTQIKDYVFSHYRSLTSVTIPNSVTSIGDGAFVESGMTHISIPASVTTIGDMALSWCPKLTGIWVDACNPNFYSDQYGVLFNKDKSNLILAPSELPNGYIIPDSVTIISKRAFSFCDNLIDIEISKNVTVIGTTAFYECRNLTNITIPRSLHTIKVDAFMDCNKLENVFISDLAAWCKIDFAIHYNEAYQPYCRYAAHPFYYASNLYLNGEKITDLVIPDGVDEINDYAFFYCGCLNSVTIPESVTSIGSWAFYGCGLTSISLPKNIELDPWFPPFQFSEYTIKHAVHGGVNPYSEHFDYIMSSAEISHYQTQLQAVDNCTETYGYCPVCDMYIFWSKKENGAHNFKNGVCDTCGIIESVGRKTCGENVYWDIDEQGVLTISGTGDMMDYQLAPWYNYRAYIKKIIVSDGVTSTGRGSFVELENVTDVSIADSVTRISGFGMCTSLVSIHLPQNIREIPSYMFYGCSNLNSIIIPDGVTKIGGDAFHDSGLTTISIPSSVTSIDDGAFMSCENLTSVTIPNSVTTLGCSLFFGCSKLTDVTLPEGITEIPFDFFGCCDSLKSVIIPNSVTSIRDSAFWGCDNLESITIPDGVTDIGFDAFGYCRSLTDIVIPDTVTSIGALAFENCDQLTQIVIPAGVTDIHEAPLFWGCDALERIVFVGNAPTFGETAFEQGTFSVYYPADNPTWTEDIMQDYAGDITWVPYETTKPKFDSAAISLKEDISIKFGVSGGLFQHGVYTEPFAIFQIGYTTQKVTDYTVSDGKYYFACTHISPSQIGDTVTATVYAMQNGEEVQLDSIEYGVSTYCYNMLAKTDDEALRTLLVDLLNYGSAAQKYAGYKTNSLSNSQLTEEQKTWGTAEEPELGSVLNTKYQTVKNAKATWKAAGLVLENSVTMRFRFAAESTEGLSVKIIAAGKEWNITEFEPVPGKDGQYYVYFSGLSARQMRESVFVTVYEGSTRVSNTLRYSVETYAYSKLNDTNVKLVDLVKAMMRYGISAENYLN